MSLHDIYMQRMVLANPHLAPKDMSQLNSLSDHVVKVIEKQQEEQKAQKQARLNEVKQMEQEKRFENTNAGKFEKAVTINGGKRVTAYTPIKKEKINSANNQQLFKEARSLGVSIAGKTVEQVQEEITTLNMENRRDFEEASNAALEDGAIETFTEDSTGKITRKVAPATILGGSLDSEQMQLLLDGIEGGRLDPALPTYSRNDRSIIGAEAERRGINLAAMTSEKKAVESWLRSANSVKQTNLRQVIDSVLGSLSELKRLNSEFERTGWTPTNKAELWAATTGTNPTKRDIATKYVSQINLLTDELGQVFMGGNSPTDRALKLAGEVLNKDYGFEQMTATLDTVEKNINYRLNAINNSSPQLQGGQLVSSPLLATSDGAFEQTEESLDKKKALYNELRQKGHSIEYSRGRAGL